MSEPGRNWKEYDWSDAEELKASIKHAPAVLVAPPITPAADMKPGTLLVKASPSLRVRKEPRRGAEIVATLAEGTLQEVKAGRDWTAGEYAWLEILLPGGQRGWVAAVYLPSGENWFDVYAEFTPAVEGEPEEPEPEEPEPEEPDPPTTGGMSAAQWRAFLSQWQAVLVYMQASDDGLIDAVLGVQASIQALLEQIVARNQAHSEGMAALEAMLAEVLETIPDDDPATAVIRGGL